ncbi:MAG TPA: hypothetical protein VLA78_06290 [Paracoccaceae bacterium]|nr:hypothetical protein [Paracoccaceae bacterium]
MRRLALLSVLALLAACGTPQERCIARETRDLRILDRLITETEGNIARGFALEEYTTYEDYWATCYRPVPGEPPAEGQRPRPQLEPYPCLKERTVTETRAKAIDLNAERAKLASMQDKRRALARAADAAIAQCRVQFPE